MRWIGTLVADAHRILLNDGIFYYPATSKYPHGKIRLMYEGIPFSYIFKIAGGVGLSDNFENMLYRIPFLNLDNPHKTCCIILASDTEHRILNNHMVMYEEFKY